MKTIPLLTLTLLLTACAQPWLPQPVTRSAATGYTGTASLAISTPYGASRAAVSAIQATVEPENLLALVDRFQVTLTSLAQTKVQDFAGSEASSLVVTGLVEASDWVVEILAFDATNTPVGRFFWDQGGVTTVEGSTSNWGVVHLSPLAGTGTSEFHLQLNDLPSDWTSTGFDFDLELLTPSGQVDVAGDKTRVIPVWSGNTLRLETQSASGPLATGSYRLALHFQDNNGVPVTMAPTFVVNLYPNLVSSKTLSAAGWSSNPPAPSVTFLDPIPANSGLVFTWKPDSGNPAGYDWVWYPISGTVPDPGTFVNTGLPTEARQGFLPAGNGVSALRPSWTLAAGVDYDGDRMHGPWALYTRAVTAQGLTGPWSVSQVDLQTQLFNILVTSVNVDVANYTGAVRLVKTAAPDLDDGTFATQPLLATRGIVLSSLGSLEIDLSPGWLVTPSQFLTVMGDSENYRVNLSRLDRTRPGKTYDLHLIGSIDSSSKGYYEAFDAPIGGGFATETWSVRPRDANKVEARVVSASYTPPNVFSSLPVAFEFASLVEDPVTNLDQPDQASLKTISADIWTDMTWVNVQEHLSDGRRVVVRAVFTEGTVTYYGPWSQPKLSPPISLAVKDVTFGGGFLSWVASTGTTLPGGGSIAGYEISKNGEVVATTNYESTSYNVASFLPGTYSVKTLFLRPDGSLGSSAAVLWPRLSYLPSEVTADTMDRRPEDPGYNAGSTQGRFTYVAPAKPYGGWLLSGIAGSEGDVFVSKFDSTFILDSKFGFTSPTYGVLYHPNATFGGRYFDDSLGFANDPNGGAIYVNGYLQNGVGNDFFRKYSFQGVHETGFNSGTGAFTQASRVPIGRLVLDTQSASLYGLEWNESGSSYGVLKLSLDGATSEYTDLTPGPLHRVAVTDDGSLVTIGVTAGTGEPRVSRFTGSPLSLDVTFGGTGEVTVTVDSVTPTWTDMILSQAGKILLVGHANNTGYVVRLNDDGTLDESFNATGWVKLLIYDLPTDVAVDEGDNVLVVGNTTLDEGDGTHGFLKRFTSVGVLDPWFDWSLGGGTSHGFGAESVAVDGQGRILVVGFSKNDGVPNSSNTTPAFWSF